MVVKYIQGSPNWLNKKKRHKPALSISSGVEQVELKLPRMGIKEKWARCDKWLVVVGLALMLLGLVLVYDASVFQAYNRFGDQWYFARNQVIWFGLGLLGAITAFVVSINIWYWLAVPLMGLVIFLLLIVLMPGVSPTVLGAKRWIAVGPIVIQPSEITKLAYSLYISRWVEKRQNIAAFVLLNLILVILIMLEPDLGTTILIASLGFVVYFLSGVNLYKLVLLLTAGITLGVGMIAVSPYRRSRIETFFDVDRDPLGSSYQIRQILISLGNGGLTGVGLGQSRQKFQYLPEVSTDSIFGVAAEETGFAGSSAIISLYVIIVWRGYKVAKQLQFRFGKYLAAALASWIGIQAMINLAAMVALIPLTGITLPFVSYGGSSLVMTMIGWGLLLNLSSYREIKPD